MRRETEKMPQELPEASETHQDPSFKRDPDLRDKLALEGMGEMRAIGPYAKKDPKDNPRRATGIHPAIRATSTDDEPLTYPAPVQDEPHDDTPGERENPRRELEDEDFIEDVAEDN